MPRRAAVPAGGDDAANGTAVTDGVLPVAKQPKKEKKQKKVRVEEVDAVQAEAASKQRKSSQPAAEEAAGGGVEHSADAGEAAADGGRGRSRSTISIVPKELHSYLSEVHTHFLTLIDDEERQLLVGNVLEEIKGSEPLVAGDPACSRMIEALLAHAEPAQLISFLSAILDMGGALPVAVSPFGSHCLERVLVRLTAAHDGLEEAEYEALTKLLTGLTTELCDKLWDFITCRYATHVARRVLCVLAGADVLPPGSKGQASAASAALKAAADADGAVEEGQTLAAATRPTGPKVHKRSALAEKLGGDDVAAQRGPAGGLGMMFGAADGDGPPAARFPELLEAVVHVLCREDYAGESMAELTANQHASPFLQAALKAAATAPNSRKLLCSLIPALMGATFVVDGVAKAGKVLEGVAAEKFEQMLYDPAASHVVEGVVGVAASVPGLLDEMVSRFFKGKLEVFCGHGTANYVVQALLAATRTSAQVLPLFNELGEHLGLMLRSRRSGVVAALVAACGRTGCCQKEVCARLATALCNLAPQWEGKPEVEVVAPALLTLDVYGVNVGDNLPLPQAQPGGAAAASAVRLPRLSTLGASILISILKFTQGACRVFTDSVAQLGTADLARVGQDPGGSRVLEALLGGTAPAKVKQKLLASMCGAFGVMALTGSGSFLVERCFDWGEPEVKAGLVADLVAAERALAGKHWGPRLMSRIGLEAFKRDPVVWRQRVQSAQKDVAVFNQLFGKDSGPAAGGAANKTAGKARDAGAAPIAPSHEAQQRQQKKEAKLAKRKAAAMAVETTADDPQEAALPELPVDAQGPGMPAEQVLGAADEVEPAVLVAPKKKQKKGKQAPLGAGGAADRLTEEPSHRHGDGASGSEVQNGGGVSVHTSAAKSVSDPLGRKAKTAKKQGKQAPAGQAAAM